MGSVTVNLNTRLPSNSEPLILVTNGPVTHQVYCLVILPFDSAEIPFLLLWMHAPCEKGGEKGSVTFLSLCRMVIFINGNQYWGPICSFAVMWCSESWACIWIDERDNSLSGVNKLLCRYTFRYDYILRTIWFPLARGNIQLSSPLAFFFFLRCALAVPLFSETEVSNVATASKNSWVFQSSYLLIH